LSGRRLILCARRALTIKRETSDLAWAQANIEKSKANAQLGQADLERYRPLMERAKFQSSV